MRSILDNLAATPLDQLETQTVLDLLKQGLKKTPQQSRDDKHVIREYHVEKYGEYLKQETNSTHDVRRVEQGSVPKNLVFTVKNKFYRADGIESCIATDRWILDLINNIIKEDEVVCDLGCGYGHIVSQIEKGYGGEYTENGVRLAQNLGHDVRHFDFKRYEDYDFIRPNSVVMTMSSIEQLPSAACVINGLKSQRKKIRIVVNFEPTLPKGDDELSLLRREYTQKNDYNTDLEDIITSSEDILPLYIEHDIIGINPLNPINLYVWKFKNTCGNSRKSVE